MVLFSPGLKVTTMVGGERATSEQCFPRRVHNHFLKVPNSIRQGCGRCLTIKYALGERPSIPQNTELNALCLIIFQNQSHRASELAERESETEKEKGDREREKGGGGGGRSLFAIF